MSDNFVLVIPDTWSGVPDLPKQTKPPYVLVELLNVPTKKIVYAFPEPGILPVNEEPPLKFIA